MDSGEGIKPPSMPPSCEAMQFVGAAQRGVQSSLIFSVHIRSQWCFLPALTLSGHEHKHRTCTQIWNPISLSHIHMHANIDTGDKIRTLVIKCSGHVV